MVLSRRKRYLDPSPLRGRIARNLLFFNFTLIPVGIFSVYQFGEWGKWRPSGAVVQSEQNRTDNGPERFGEMSVSPHTVRDKLIMRGVRVFRKRAGRDKRKK